MKIGIVGAGNIGGTLARKLAAAGHTVKLASSRGPEAIREQAEKIGAIPVASKDAVNDVDVIVLSIPFARVSEVAHLFEKVPADTVVIDTSNYYPQRDGHIAEVDAGKPESVWASEQLGRPVVKTFNAFLAHTLSDGGKPSGAPGRIAIPLAGDDAGAKIIATAIVDAVGFDVVDNGDLANSWRQQPGTPAYCTELSAPELASALAAADRQRAPNDRDTLMQEFMRTGRLPNHESVVALNRTVTAVRR